VLKRRAFKSVVIIALLCLGQPILKAQLLSDFAATTEGWNTVGMCPAESSPGATWSATGGFPSGGCLRAQDNSIGVFYWFAGGASWKGNLSAYYGCYLYFDSKTNNIGAPVGSKYDVLIIRNDDETISFNTTPNPGLSWTSYVVPLFEGAWIVDGPLNAVSCPDLVGPLATAADMLSYLGDIKKIRIRAEFGGLSSEWNYLDNVEINCDPILLPVELGEFNAFELDKGRSRLEWTTYSEQNALGFQIEKSLTGEVFDSIGFLPAAGYSDVTLNYAFIDNQFSADAYYRLKQVKFDYRSFYSDVLLLKQAATVLSPVEIYPNPATTEANIVVSLNQDVLYWEVVDFSGKQIIHVDVNDYSESYTYNLNVSSWNSGFYIFKLHTKSGVVVRKFQVLK